jgi:hypothetical protein
LSAAGLPQKEIVPALLFFNVGVESGQLAFIAGLLALVATASVIGLTLERLEYLGGYALGVPAAFWFFQRLQMF